jgi:Fur family iron response transcriptional regulator
MDTIRLHKTPSGEISSSQEAVIGENASVGVSKHDVVEMLLNHDIQPTRQRIEIAHVLFERPQHISADQVLTSVNKNRAIASKATVYNTLGLFTEKKLIREIIVDPARVFYDSNNTPHHHLYNVETNELADIFDDSFGIERLPNIPHGMVVEGVDVIVRVRPENSE